jgi:hypothetical protein
MLMSWWVSASVLLEPVHTCTAKPISENLEQLQKIDPQAHLAWCGVTQPADCAGKAL